MLRKASSLGGCLNQRDANQSATGLYASITANPARLYPSVDSHDPGAPNPSSVGVTIPARTDTRVYESDDRQPDDQNKTRAAEAQQHDQQPDNNQDECDRLKCCHGWFNVRPGSRMLLQPGLDIFQVFLVVVIRSQQAERGRSPIQPGETVIQQVFFG